MKEVDKISFVYLKNGKILSTPLKEVRISTFIAVKLSPSHLVGKTVDL